MLLLLWNDNRRGKGVGGGGSGLGLGARAVGLVEVGLRHQVLAARVWFELDHGPTELADGRKLAGDLARLVVDSL